MFREKNYIYRVEHYLRFQASAAGSWNIFPVDKGGLW